MGSETILWYGQYEYGKSCDLKLQDKRSTQRCKGAFFPRNASVRVLVVGQNGDKIWIAYSNLHNTMTIYVL